MNRQRERERERERLIKGISSTDIDLVFTLSENELSANGVFGSNERILSIFIKFVLIIY